MTMYASAHSFNASDAVIGTTTLSLSLNQPRLSQYTAK
jgi:hypothetical protein